MHAFRRLEVWQESVEIPKTIYELTGSLPAEERYGLTAQLRSAAVSVSSNIAEGAGRDGPRELARYLRMALGSLAEVDSQLELAFRLGLLQRNGEIAAGSSRLRRRIYRLHDRLTGEVA